MSVWRLSNNASPDIVNSLCSYGRLKLEQKSLFGYAILLTGLSKYVYHY